MNNIPWVEKYRPQKFNNIVLNEMNRQIYSRMTIQELSNLLNNYHTTRFGRANVGALYYVSLRLDDIL